MLLALPLTLQQDLPVHSHDIHEIMIALNDHGMVRSARGEAQFKTGASYLISAGVEHGISMDSGGASEIMLICFDNLAIDSYLDPTAKLAFQALVEKGFSMAPADMDKQCNNLVLSRELNRALANRNKFQNEIAGGLLNVLLLSHLSLVQLPLQQQTIKDQKIQNVIMWIETNLSDNLSVDSAAEQAKMSRAVFTKQFRQVTRKSFAEYVAIARLERVESLLSQPDANITDIAFQSGFRNLGHFYKSFQKHYNMTPNQYRKMLIQQGL